MNKVDSMWSDRQAIELFHLVFVVHLGRRVDKSLFAIKGGCNLRFFCKSIRYSEDIDFDIRTMGRSTLENNVKRILASSAFTQDLQAKRITIEHVTAAKQTDTTQRWKLGIRAGEGPPLPTKIEFSRRAGLDSDPKLEAVDPDLVRTYHLHPVLAQHYSGETAFGQKILALSRRNETQARDIFDLKLLLDGGAGKRALGAVIKAEIPRAVENALTIGFDDFSGQVRAFLLPEYFDYYSQEVWAAMQGTVVARLEALA